jgi:hypothetical protein
MQKIPTVNGLRHGRDIAIRWVISQHQLYAAWISPGCILSRSWLRALAFFEELFEEGL